MSESIGPVQIIGLGLNILLAVVMISMTSFNCGHEYAVNSAPQFDTPRCEPKIALDPHGSPLFQCDLVETKPTP